ncbi:hypothetical protein Bcep22_gp22 [Burkholderia phage Bcep22]|uniref:Uncharacterized protein n=1 Tax=Burkholderia phage Bcep22 TaxID=2883944 RepID=Q6V7S2_9CAUD|nr:hypothetical protein Bcep22_gp22 [Burkholderia phage Bcep22]AAQ54956.2 hypothetical protein Bcep22_gp22 [Burkholderia phage Bcep22]
MSKRFGRNQRRRAREQIAALESQVSNLKAALSARQEQIAQMANELADCIEYEHAVASMVGHLSIAAGEPSFLGNVFDGMRLVPQRAAAALKEYGLHDIEEVVRTETLRLLSIETVAEPMRRTILVETSLTGRRAAYAVSETALQMPRDAIASMLRRQVAAALVELLLPPARRRG